MGKLHTKRRRLRAGALSVAERSYPTSEVSGGQEETHCLRGAARRSHLEPEARGGDLEEPPRAKGQGRQLGGATHA